MEGKIPWDGIEKIGDRGESSEELGRGEEGGAWRHNVPSWARSRLLPGYIFQLGISCFL